MRENAKAQRVPETSVANGTLINILLDKEYIAFRDSVAAKLMVVQGLVLSVRRAIVVAEI